MTDRQILLKAAMAAVRSVKPGTTCRGEAIIEALSSLPSVGGWLPIESAEIQGYEQNPPVLVHTAMGIGIANYGLGNDGMYDWFAGSRCVTPTHYMPLPAPPIE